MDENIFMHSLNSSQIKIAAGVKLIERIKDP